MWSRPGLTIMQLSSAAARHVVLRQAAAILRRRKMKFRYAICMSAMAICFAFSAFAQGLPKASKPEELGFSSERLKRLAPAFQADIDKGTIPGAVVLVARNGKVAYLEAFGFQNHEKK